MRVSESWQRNLLGVATPGWQRLIIAEHYLPPGEARLTVFRAQSVSEPHGEGEPGLALELNLARPSQACGSGAADLSKPAAAT